MIRIWFVHCISYPINDAWKGTVIYVFVNISVKCICKVTCILRVGTWLSGSPFPVPLLWSASPRDQHRFQLEFPFQAGADSLYKSCGASPLIVRATRGGTLSKRSSDVANFVHILYLHYICTLILEYILC